MTPHNVNHSSFEKTCWSLETQPMYQVSTVSAKLLTLKLFKMDQQTCETPGCDKAAKLQCPTCIKLEIKGSYFCSQGPIKSDSTFNLI